METPRPAVALQPGRPAGAAGRVQPRTQQARAGGFVSQQMRAGQVRVQQARG
ncbi:MAG: hypothetical protein O2798_09340 [Chloroflexi bacterium]|nr:hypothetical protein [Chloroflexota bacterium]